MPAAPFGPRDQLVVGFLFLTRLRLPAPSGWPEGRRWRVPPGPFPWSGAVIGLLGGGAALLAHRLGLPAVAAAADRPGGDHAGDRRAAMRMGWPIQSTAGRRQGPRAQAGDHARQPGRQLRRAGARDRRRLARFQRFRRCWAAGR
ncbi:MAG: hypothetical protein WDN69_23765 [Aliidongia sp.]